MAALLKGAEVARVLTESLQAEAAALQARGVTPGLAILRVGTRGEDLSYERAATNRCDKIGIVARRIALPEDVTQERLLAEIEALNADRTIHGVLMLRPLPRHLDDVRACTSLLPAKDMDGVTGGSMTAVYAGTDTGYPPCTAEACVALLKHYGIAIRGKRVVVVGRSLVIGRPVSMLLLAEHGTVTICHSATRNLPEICREADILIVATGQAGLIGTQSVRPGQIVLDVGIHANPDGTLCGDVCFAEVEPVVEAITPVPGGVGTVTTAILARHVIAAAKKTLE